MFRYEIAHRTPYWLLPRENKWMAHRKDIALELRNHDIFLRHYSNVARREPALHDGRLVHRTVVERYFNLVGRGIAATLNNKSTTQHFSVQGTRKIANFRQRVGCRALRVWRHTLPRPGTWSSNGGHKIIMPSRDRIEKPLGNVRATYR